MLTLNYSIELKIDRAGQRLSGVMFRISKYLGFVSSHHKVCFRLQRGRWQEKAKLYSQNVGRLLLPPRLGHPGHWSGWLDPPAGMRENPKGRLAPEGLWENGSKCCPLSPVWSSDCLMLSKTTERALRLWSPILLNSSLSSVKLSKPFLEINNHLEI